METKKPYPPLILFFDETCGLCETALLWIARKDTEKRLYFAPLSGVTAKSLLQAKYFELDAALFFEKGNIFVGAAALFRALRHLPGIWRYIGYFPGWVLMPLYRVVASFRKKVPFSRKEIPQERLLP